MQKIALLLIGLGFLSCSGPGNQNSSNVESAMNVVDVTPSEAQALITRVDASEELIVLDVRTRAEFDAGHLPKATQLNFRANNFASSLESLQKDRAYLVFRA